MPEEENVRRVREFLDRILNAGDLAALQEMVHRDVILPDSRPGLENMKSAMLDQRRIFADPE